MTTDTDKLAEHDPHFEATAAALDHITTHAATSEDPQSTLHTPSSDRQASHRWLERIFPSYSSLEAMESAFHMGNYVITDRKTGSQSKVFEPMSIYVRIGMHALYYGTAQEKFLRWERTIKLLEDQSIKMGEQYDDPASVKHIRPFIQSFDLEGSLKELKEPDPEKYGTFNEFFSREIREDARPIAEPDNDTIISSPADCRLTAYPSISLAKRFWIKGYGFTIPKLLASNSLAPFFENGSLLIARLAPQDYHRWHSPVDGVIESITEVPGCYYTVNPQAINEPGTLDVFCENRRSVMIVRPNSNRDSKVAIIAVGAMLVGSILYNPGISPGREIRRGECLGAFRYGGSTVIVLFPRGEVVLDEDLVKNSTGGQVEEDGKGGQGGQDGQDGKGGENENGGEGACETLVKVGWRVGIRSTSDQGGSQNQN